MALIKCPECGQSISDRASKCPKCGYPIQEYLSSKAKEAQSENVNESSANTECSADNQQAPTQTKSKKKLVFALIAIIVIGAAIGVAFNLNLFTSKTTVEDITISKWRLTGSTKDYDYYEATITSEQKKPFIAVIGTYDDKGDLAFIYMEDGKGIYDATIHTGEDPTTERRPIGYMCGTRVDISDMEVSYEGHDYKDYIECTTCIITITIDMKHSKSGFLTFDIINETNNSTERNISALVINGKAEYTYYAELPYKTRGVDDIDISVEPKMFFECSPVTEEDYVIEKAYKAEKHEGSYSNSYSGEEILAFADCTDGYVFYTRELKEGGVKENRNIVETSVTVLHHGECTLWTYDSVDKDETILKRGSENLLRFPLYSFYVDLLAEVSLEKSGEGFAVAGFIAGHLVHGVVDRVEIVLLGELCQLRLAGGRAVLGLNAHFEILLRGVGHHIAEKLGKLRGVLRFLKAGLFPVQADFGIAFAVRDARHGKIHADLGALANEVRVQSVDNGLLHILSLIHI